VGDDQVVVFAQAGGDELIDGIRHLSLTGVDLLGGH
jgi:hypothetical protein